MASIQDNWMISTYRPKDCEFSATDICSPTAQLWAKLHMGYEEDKTTKTVGFKSFLGSALHNAIEKIDEDGVIKEFSWVRALPDGTRIGGTTDELRWRTSINKWRLGDIKLKTDYSAKKFLGVGTKANPKPKPEQDKEILQMSIYRWLFEGMFDIDDKAVIYLFVPGHSSWAKYPEKQEVWLDLKPIKEVDTYIKRKINLARAPEQPARDCPEWMCKFCDFHKACKYAPEETKEAEFKDESE